MKLNVRLGVLASSLFLVFCIPALAVAQGTISGTITKGPPTTPAVGVSVIVYDANNGIVGGAVTDEAGHYEAFAFGPEPVAFGPGTYYVATYSDGQHLIDELYNDLPCPFLLTGFSGSCTPSAGTGVVVTNGPVTGVNFALARGATIRGVVTNAGGSPLASVVVYVSDSSGTLLATAVTDSLGAWETGAGLLPGTYFAATSNGSNYVNEAWNNIVCAVFCPGTGTPIVINGTETISNINFALDPGGSIAGIVTDGSNPLSGVVVHAYTASGVPFAAWVTENGVYEIKGLPAGNYYVRTFNGFGLVDELYNNIPCTGSCSVTSGTQVFVATGGITSGVNFSLSAGGPVGTVSGTVRAAGSNAPIANARVDIYDSLGRFVTSTVTNASGSYGISLSPGSYFAIASADGYLREHVITRGTPIAVPLSGGSVSANFTLTPGARISGVVRGAGGVPLANTEIDVYSTDGRILITRDMTNGSGQYITSDGLAPGTYLLRTRNSAGHIDQSRTVTITGPGTLANVDFTLASGAMISGTITDAATGAALANVEVLLFDAAGNWLDLNAQTNASGQFVFAAGVPAGTYYAATSNQIGYIDEAFGNVMCVQATCDLTATTPIAVGATTIPNINFQLTRGGGISGEVRGIGSTIPSPGIPLPNETVEIYADNGLFIGTATTNASGFYTVQTGLPAGTYFVKTANTAGFVDQVFNGKTCVDCPVNLGDPVTVAVGVITPNINFTLQRGGRISGTIFDSTSGLPLPNAPVIVRDAAGTTVATIETDDAGVYRVSLPAGRYYVQTGGIDGYTTSIYNPAAGLDRAQARDARRFSNTGQWIPAPSDEGACPRGLCDISSEFAIDVAEGGDKTAINVSVTSSPSAASMDISPTTLPVGTPGVFYSQPLTATGGTAPYGYTVTEGALPLGLSLHFDTGVISGTPTTSGFSMFTVAASDMAGVSTTRTYTLTISERAAGLPGPPLNLAASVENFQGRFTWTPGTGGEATSYRLEVGLNPGGTVAAFETPDATPSIDIPFIPPGVYWARVRGRNEYGLGAPLDEYRLLVTAAGYSAPGAPANVVAAIAANVLTVTWDPGPGGTPATGYILEAGTAPGLSNIAALNLGNARAFNYTGVPTGVYYLRVRAYNVAGASEPSREVVLNVGNLPAAPGVPIALTRTVTGSTVTLNWLPPSDGGAPTSYVIEAGSSRGLANIAAFDTGSTTPQFTVNAVPPGAYWVRIRARNAQGVGSPTADIRLVVP